MNIRCITRTVYALPDGREFATAEDARKAIVEDEKRAKFERLSTFLEPYLRHREDLPRIVSVCVNYLDRIAEILDYEVRPISQRPNAE